MPSSTSPPASPRAALPPAGSLPPCHTDQLALRSADVVPETGEHGFSVWMKNAGGPCDLSGYPSVQLLDEHGSALPVRFHHGGRYTTTQPPGEVVLPTGAEAVVVVAKFRCDLGPGEPAPSAQIVLPGSTAVTRLQLIGNNLAYCGAAGEGDADDVYVSPIEASYAAAVGH